MIAVGLALAAGLTAVTYAQTPEKMVTAHGGHAWKASDLIGQSVYTTGDQEKGKIKDLMIAPDGKVLYAAVAFGGFAGLGEKLFAIPLDAIHLEWKDNKVNRARVDVTEESIKQRQGFDDKHWPEAADRGFLMTK
jgi:hypothetical protein